MNKSLKKQLRVKAEQRKQRIDKVLAASVDASRTDVQRWLEQGRVTLDGQVARRRDTVAPGQLIEYEAAPSPLSSAEPDSSVEFDVLFEDDSLVVVMKPAGLVVHPARGHATGTLVNGLLARSGFGRPPADPDDEEGYLRPGIVHRLDKDTSGLMVVAKTAIARESLKRQFGERTVVRRYRALTVGVPRSARLESLHGRSRTSRLRFTTAVSDGRHAITNIKLIERLAAGSAALVECRLETGRTHQIRVHLLELAETPILADALYGSSTASEPVTAVAAELGRQALHAGVLGFEHPESSEALLFESPLPEDMAAALKALRALS